jgi:hypothetical protein
MQKSTSNIKNRNQNELTIKPPPCPGFHPLLGLVGCGPSFCSRAYLPGLVAPEGAALTGFDRGERFPGTAGDPEAPEAPEGRKPGLAQSGTCGPGMFLSLGSTWRSLGQGRLFKQNNIFFKKKKQAQFVFVSYSASSSGSHWLGCTTR